MHELPGTLQTRDSRQQNIGLTVTSLGPCPLHTTAPTPAARATRVSSPGRSPCHTSARCRSSGARATPNTSSCCGAAASPSAAARSSWPCAALHQRTASWAAGWDWRGKGVLWRGTTALAEVTADPRLLYRPSGIQHVRDSDRRTSPVMGAQERHTESRRHVAGLSGAAKLETREAEKSARELLNRDKLTGTNSGADMKAALATDLSDQGINDCLHRSRTFQLATELIHDRRGSGLRPQRMRPSSSSSPALCRRRWHPGPGSMSTMLALPERLGTAFPGSGDTSLGWHLVLSAYLPPLQSRGSLWPLLVPQGQFAASNGGLPTCGRRARCSTIQPSSPGHALRDREWASACEVLHTLRLQGMQWENVGHPDSASCAQLLRQEYHGALLLVLAYCTAHP